MKRFLLSLFALCGAVAAATAQEEPLKLPEPEFIGQTLAVLPDDTTEQLVQESLTPRHRSSTGQKLFGIGRDHIEEMTLNGTQARNRFRKDDGIAFIVRVPDNGIDPMSVISVFRFKRNASPNTPRSALSATGSAIRWRDSPSRRAVSASAPT